MADWNPSLYLQFASERTRPAAELLARIAKPSAKHIADLGCGPGNSTELLRGAWPDAVITGVDNSPAMLDKAQKALPDCQFVNADIGAWQPEQPLDVLYANASLQWVSGHPTLFPHLASLLAKDGVLAVQMPDNWQEPSHALMRQVAAELGHPAHGRIPLESVQRYYDLLSGSGCEVDVWRTTYFHPMASHQAIVEWLSATGLRPFLQDLDSVSQKAFLSRYLQLLEQHYPRQQNDQILLAFPRLFIIARRVTS
ncbi:trans-aconitate 2-methyltransferase [Scandinavium goeteborgense]|uniref:Trans-aconitate 2-methyltransferase n=1 Tax=Scandinavium goeteborgense TaxID=1851514 RepID=A0A4R6EE61_SCAGO|nr:trans-aconitate 2-methyltransferase [Scandinavium goeteborgense]TDN56516.1 trans-aconitate 2-methyltransferase [Scandinavium goeteborgense]